MVYLCIRKPKTHSLYLPFLSFPFIEHVTRENDYDVVLACQDNLIRIVAGSVLVGEVPTDAPVTAIASRDDNYMRSRKGVASIVFGMEDGAISATNVSSDGTSRTLWITMDAPKRSPVETTPFFTNIPPTYCRPFFCVDALSSFIRHISTLCDLLFRVIRLFLVTLDTSMQCID